MGERLPLSSEDKFKLVFPLSSLPSSFHPFISQIDEMSELESYHQELALQQSWDEMNARDLFRKFSWPIMRVVFSFIKKAVLSRVLSSVCKRWQRQFALRASCKTRMAALPPGSCSRGKEAVDLTDDMGEVPRTPSVAGPGRVDAHMSGDFDMFDETPLGSEPYNVNSSSVADSLMSPVLKGLPSPLVVVPVSRNGVKPDPKNSVAFFPHSPKLAVGQTAGEPPTGPMYLEYDLTLLLAEAGVTASTHSTAAGYHADVFTHAQLLLKPVLRELTGTDCYYKEHLRYDPGSWNATGTAYPPHYRGGSAAPGKLMPRFGVVYSCDFKRISGCPCTVKLRREYGRYPEKEVFSLEVSASRHRHACVHQTKLHGSSGPNAYLPDLHPVAHLFIREEARRDPSITMQKLRPLLRKHLIDTTHLHCQHPHSREDQDHAVEMKKETSICWHRHCHSYKSQQTQYRDCDKMPPTVVETRLVKPHARAARVRTDINVTADVAVSVHHMVVEDAVAQSGSWAFEKHFDGQVEEKLGKYKRLFGTDKTYDPAMPRDATIGEYYRSFAADNLYQYWRNFASARPGEVPPQFDVYSWRMIALLYRQKEKEDTAPLPERPWVPVDEQWIAELEEDSEATSSADFEYVTVFASMASLIVSVKAWACRSVSGVVQVGLDHMYNMVKGIPQVSPSEMHLKALHVVA